jgi:acyl-coenzyme A thioesterase PaaI-like protein
MKTLRQIKFFLWFFGRFKVPMIGYVNPKLIKVDDKEAIVRIRLKRKTKNHLKSMYFGALSVGADIAGGLHAFYFADMEKCKISMVFKSFNAEFIKRPMDDVYFISNCGSEIKQMIEKSKASKERINQKLELIGETRTDGQPETIAKFILELSIKVI